MRRARLLLVVLAGVAVCGSARLARAETAGAAVADDAWYSASPTCGLPTGCGPTDSLPSNPRYPAGTLHVGVAGGQEEARTYLRLNLESLPPDAELDGGVLRVPVAGSDAGTNAADTATLQACLASAPFGTSAGSFAPPPAIDCNVKSPASYSTSPVPQFTIDLTPFASAWTEGANNGIALVPAAGQAPNAVWHVAFSAHDGADAFKPTSQLRFTPASVETGSDEYVPLHQDDVAVADMTGPVFTPVVPPDVVSAPTSPAQSIVTQSKEPLPATPVVSRRTAGYAYPLVLAAPLLLVALGGYFVWALTRPMALASVSRH